jgi:hypothetical protein
MTLKQWDRKDDADYLELCRIKRNKAEYDRTGVATEQDAEELIEFAKDLRNSVMDWLKQHRPELVTGK